MSMPAPPSSDRSPARFDGTETSTASLPSPESIVMFAANVRTIESTMMLSPAVPVLIVSESAGLPITVIANARAVNGCATSRVLSNDVTRTPESASP